MLRLFVLSCVLLLSHGQVPETDVITCDLKDCNYMCVCQKLVWTTDFNHPILGGSTGAFYMYIFHDRAAPQRTRVALPHSTGPLC